MATRKRSMPLDYGAFLARGEVPRVTVEIEAIYDWIALLAKSLRGAVCELNVKLKICLGRWSSSLSAFSFGQRIANRG